MDILWIFHGYLFFYGYFVDFYGYLVNFNGYLLVMDILWNCMDIFVEPRLSGLLDLADTPSLPISPLNLGSTVGNVSCNLLLLCVAEWILGQCRLGGVVVVHSCHDIHCASVVTVPQD